MPLIQFPSTSVSSLYVFSSGSSFYTAIALPIAVSNLSGYAPTTVSNTLPSLKTMNVGIARMPSSCAISGDSSTSTWMKCASVYFSEYLFAHMVNTSISGSTRSNLPFNFGSDRLAGSAPSCKGVEDDDFLSLGIKLVVGSIGGLGKVGVGGAVLDDRQVVCFPIVENVSMCLWRDTSRKYRCFKCGERNATYFWICSIVMLTVVL
jgi:hypothetical protein